MTAYEELQCRVNKLIAALTYGDGSIREELALMAEGEVSSGTYAGISKHALTKLDLAIKEFQGEGKMKTVALLGGYDWADASVDILDIPDDMDIDAVRKEWQEWYNTVYRPSHSRDGVVYKNVIDLMIEKGAKISNIEKVEI